MLPAFETERLEALRALDVLDSPPESQFEAIVAGARHLFGCQMAFVSLIDVDRQWFKAGCGLDATETPREVAICAHTIAANEPLVVPDTLRDPRFATNPLIVGPPNIRFYAGVPLRTSLTRDSDPLPIGTLCVADDRPQIPSPDKLEMLAGMAHVVETLLESRRANRESLRLAIDRQEALLVSERNQRLLEHAERMAQVGSWRLDLESEFAHWSAQTYAIHGLKAGDGTDLQDALTFYPPHERVRIERAVDACSRDGQPWDMELDFYNVSGELRRIRTVGEAEFRDERIVAVIGVIQDITERHRTERRLLEAAHTDELTGLASRRAFNKHLDEAIAASLASGSALAVAILDLDRFKEVNDRLGHAAGDDVLRDMSATLRAVTYLGDCFAARLGGDEFVILLHGPAAWENLAPGLSRLLADLRVDVPAAGDVIAVSSTIGCCVIDANHATRSTILKAADDALYEAKRRRRGTAAIAGRIGVIEPAKDRLARRA